jgi:putative ABC transport system permease protein
MGTNLKTALKALLQNRLQALLTLSGMSVGVAMVVIVSGLGLGAQLTIESQIESAGPTQITVRPGNFVPAAIVSSGEQDSGGGEVSQGTMSDGINDSRAGLEVASSQPHRVRRQALKNRTPVAPLADAEMRLLKQQVANVRAVAGSVEGNVSLDDDADAPVRVVRVYGFESDWPEMGGWRLAQGRWITPEEHAAGAPVAVVAAPVMKRLWPSAQTALGRTLKMGGNQVRIVGILSKAGPSTDNASVVVPTINVPLPLAQSLLHRPTFDAVMVRTTSVGVTTSVATQIKARLRELHQLPDDTLDDFRVETQSVAAMPSMGLDPRLARAVHSNVVGFEQASWEEMARSLRQAARTFTLLLAAAATVSLVVGGIGVMNIMLVSVAARTREIGLRMAMGARTADVMSQFLVEAVALAALGGLIGLVLGSLGLLVAKHGLHWATAVSPTMLLLAVIMAAATGVAFGFGPARRAAVLDPVIALRSE